MVPPLMLRQSMYPAYTREHPMRMHHLPPPTGDQGELFDPDTTMVREVISDVIHRNHKKSEPSGV